MFSFFSLILVRGLSTVVRRLFFARCLRSVVRGLFSVCGLWTVVCGLFFALALRSVVLALFFVCGLRTAVCGLLLFSLVFCGLWSVDCGLFSVTPAHSAQVVLQWDPNQEPDLAGYKVYYGTSSRNYQFYIDAGHQTTCTISNLAAGQTYYFSATAYDTSNNESIFSNETLYSTSPGPAPAPPPSSNGNFDMNADGKAEILWQHQTRGEIYVWYMDGTAFTRDEHIATISDDLNWKIAGVGDFNGNGKPDILWHHQQRGEVYVWFMDGPTFIRDQHIRTVGDDLNWKIAGVGDFNGDGKPDILWHHQERGEVYVWFMDGPTFIRDQHIRTVGDDLNWKIAGVGDFNGDGKPDILWHHQQRGDVYVWFMDAAKFLYDKYIRTVPDIAWQIEATGDYTGDGQTDIVWRNRGTGEVYVWYMDGATFVQDQFIRIVEDTDWKIVN